MRNKTQKKSLPQNHKLQQNWRKGPKIIILALQKSGICHYRAVLVCLMLIILMLKLYEGNSLLVVAVGLYHCTDLTTSV